LLECLKDCSLNINNKHGSDVMYIYFAKAFDSVCHSKLLVKIEAYGIHECLLCWIAAFLSGRSQAYKINNTYSDFVQYMISGVPQCSVFWASAFPNLYQ
jgi:ribonuclease P/MRP protein subunit RPP40